MREVRPHEVVTSRAAVRQPHLDYLPVGLFGSAVGLATLSTAWQLAGARYGAPLWIAPAIAVTALAAFVIVLAGYAVKLVSAIAAVRAEFHHPVAGTLFGLLPIGLLLLPAPLEPHLHRVAQVMWMGGAAAMLGFAWLSVSRWMSGRQQFADATPAWIVPVAGLLNIPLALPALGLQPLHGLMPFALAVGLFFAVPLFTVIFARLVFEPPLAAGLKPTLLILVAPFAIGYSAYAATTGRTDIFAEALYALTLFMLAVLLPQLRHLPACCPFRMSWWAVGFPLAAASTAALRFAASRPSATADAIALLILALATVIIAGLIGRTILGVFRGELRSLSA
jgi:tellurite resistance protein